MAFNTHINYEDPMEGSSFGVRKGAWTEEEDLLLKKCIQIYGEGKWHLVPARAGLNRCRKSCRLRWLNYLKPNIKRGDFAADEVDLIIRLHKLLGNRWSLIAGRLPGRTANDVKNYWNTHLLKKLNPSNKDSKSKPKPHQNPSKPNINVFKPRPWTLSISSLPERLDGNNNNNATAAAAGSVATPATNNNILFLSDENGYSSISSDNDEIIWWENLLMNVNKIEDQQQASFNNSNQSGSGNHAIYEEFGERRSKVVEEDSHGVWRDYFCDVELWEV